ncbi:hypothetical protein B566_EDAN017611 [Ephemera danica]|nr:hypothetical protein B566_EDAN017611 [Ephemera danica]
MYLKSLFKFKDENICSAFKPRVNNEWFWSNGTAFTDLNWAPGQPSNPPEVPNDATNFLVAIGGWDDDNGEEWQMSYICEQID